LIPFLSYTWYKLFKCIPLHISNSIFLLCKQRNSELWILRLGTFSTRKSQWPKAAKWHAGTQELLISHGPCVWMGMWKWCLLLATVGEVGGFGRKISWAMQFSPSSNYLTWLLMTGGTKLSLLTKPWKFYKCKMVYS